MHPVVSSTSAAVKSAVNTMSADALDEIRKAKKLPITFLFEIYFMTIIHRITAIVSQYRLVMPPLEHPAKIITEIDMDKRNPPVC